MCRHCEARQELYSRIKDGEIGEPILLRAYRQTGPVGTALTPPKPEGISELLYQIQKFHGFLWASGGCFSDFLDSQHRRMLLDERRLARLGQGLGGTLLSRRLHRPELRHLFGRIHLRRRHQAVPRRAEYSRLQPGVRQLRPRLEGGGHHFVQFTQSGPLHDLQGPEHQPPRDRLGVSPARAQPLPGRVGRLDPRHPQGQAVQRSQARGRGKPGHRDGAHGCATPAR